MPITQDRLISLVAHADALLDTLDGLRPFVKTLSLDRIASETNSALAHVEDAGVRAILRDLIGTINVIVGHINDVTDIPLHVRENIMEERVHFKKHRKSNENLAKYYRYKRHAKREMETSLAQMPEVFSDLPPEAEQEWRSRPSQRTRAQTQAAQEPSIMSDYNSPEAMAARFAGYAAEEKAERAERIAKLKEEGALELEELRERQRTRRMIPPGEEISIEEANALAERMRNPKAKPEFKPSGNGTVDPSDNNNPANLIRHLPTAEELLDNNPAPIGKDVL